VVNNNSTTESPLYFGEGIVIYEFFFLSKINFTDIQQEWLKRDTKKFIRYIATTTTSFARIQRPLLR
jgi:hypothetical protein